MRWDLLVPVFLAQSDMMRTKPWWKAWFLPKLIFFPDREPSSHADQKSIMYLIVLSSPTSTAPTSPRCSPSGTLRRPPPPPRPTEKTWQVSSLPAIRKDLGTLLLTNIWIQYQFLHFRSTWRKQQAPQSPQTSKNKYCHPAQQCICNSVVSSRDNGYTMFKQELAPRINNIGFSWNGNTWN